MAIEGPKRAFEPGALRSAPLRRLIVNADDFGRCASINAAVLQAHTQGILTTASLMVNEPGLLEAVEIARANPKLGVGLHLTFLCGHSALEHSEIPRLVDSSKAFSKNPTLTGFRFFFTPGLRDQLRREIHAQFRKFAATGLELDHVNGHLHLHLHPIILSILLQDAQTLGVRRMRLTADPLGMNLSLARGKLLYRLSHALIFALLSRRAKPLLARKRIRSTDRVFGLLQNGRVDRAYMSALLRRLPIGDSELYSHPSLDEGKHELDGLTAPEVRELVKTFGIHLIRYQDL